MPAYIWSDWVQDEEYTLSTVRGLTHVTASHMKGHLAGSVADPDTPATMASLDTSASVNTWLMEFQSGAMATHGSPFVWTAHTESETLRLRGFWEGSAGFSLSGVRDWSRTSYIGEGSYSYYNWEMRDWWSLDATQVVVSVAVVGDIPVYSDTEDIEYESSNPVVTWDDWPVSVLLHGGVSQGVSSYEAVPDPAVIAGDVAVPSLDISYKLGNGVADGYGTTPGFFAIQDWPQHSDMTVLGSLDFPDTTPIDETVSRTIPLHEIPGSVSEFTLVLSPRFLLPGQSLTPPSMVIPQLVRPISTYDGLTPGVIESDATIGSTMLVQEARHGGFYGYQNPTVRIKPPRYRTRSVFPYQSTDLSGDALTTDVHFWGG